MRWRISALSLLAVAILFAWMVLRRRPSQLQAPVERAGPAVPVARQTTAARADPAQPAIVPAAPRMLRGRVLGPNGPIAGATVTLLSMQDTELLAGRSCACTMNCHEQLLGCHCDDAAHEVAKAIAARSGEAPPVGSTSSDREGHFEFTDLAPGKYALWAESGELVGTRADAHDGDQADLRIGLGIRLEGHVTGEDHKGFKGALVTAVHPQASKFIETISGADGRFTIGPLPLADYPVVASGKALLSAASHGNAGDDFNLVLHPPRSLHGRVVRDGRPAARVSVKLDGFQKREVVSNDEGRFAFEDLSPGRYTAEARDGALVASSSTVIKIERPPDDMLLQLAPGGVLEGAVTDEAGPIREAKVNVRAHGQTATDADGHYRFELMLPGSYSANVSAPGHIDGELTPQISAGQTTQENVVLRRSAPLSGTVVAQDGTPLEKVRLRVRALNISASAYSGKDGTFVLDGLEAGRYELEIEHTGYIRQRASADAPSNALRFVLARGGIVRGRVVDATGPIAGAQIAAARDDGRNSNALEAKSDDRGEFELSGLSDGRWTFTAQAGGGKGRWSLEEDEGLPARQARAIVELHGGGTQSIELRIGAGGTIRGVVHDRHGRPVRAASVYAMAGKAETFPARAITDANGAFVIEALVEKTYHVGAYKQGFEEPAAVDDVAVGSKIEITVGDSVFAEGRVVDGAGSPVTRFSLNDKPIEDAGGHFRVPVPSYGKLALRIFAPGFVTAVRQFDVSSDHDATLGDIVLGQGRDLHGTVVDALTGKPIRAAHVVARYGNAAGSEFAMKVDFGFNLEQSAEVEATTDEAGSFVLSHLDRTQVTITAGANPYAPGTASADPDQDEIVIRLSQGEIAGRVTDGSGKPLVGTVILYPDGPYVKTGADGSFTVRPASAGEHRLAFMQDRAQVFPPRIVKVAGQGTTHFDLAPEPGSVRLQVHVSGVDEFVQVRVARDGEDAEQMLSAMSDHDLDVGFWVAPGRYVATVYGGDNRMERSVVVGAAGARLDLPLSR
jgi:protocatechuate 3,4-dioxygenase beta subunit